MLLIAPPNTTLVALVATRSARAYVRRMYYKPRGPEPTTCPKCTYCNGGVFFVCPICKHELLVEQNPTHNRFGGWARPAEHGDMQPLVDQQNREREPAHAPPGDSAEDF